jgi:hypothetical protein
MAVLHVSVHDFVALSTDEAYVAGVRHRTAALADSRLLRLAY